MARTDKNEPAPVWKPVDSSDVFCFPDCAKNGCTAARCRRDDDDDDPMDWRDFIDTDL